MRKSYKLHEALHLLLQAREHIDRHGVLDSEGRTLVMKATKLLKESNVRINFEKLRRRWDEEDLERVIAQLVDLLGLSP